MTFTVELVLKSYMPKQLEKGMWFITKLHQGTLKEYSEIWALDKLPIEPMEEFILKNGAPVEPYLIYGDDDIVAYPHHIGWWDEGPEHDDLRDIELKDVNLIINEYDGYVEIEIDEHDFAHEEVLSPILYADKVTMYAPETYNEEEDDDEGPWLCSACNGSGYGSTPDTTCLVCKGEGEVYDEKDDNDYDLDDNS